MNNHTKGAFAPETRCQFCADTSTLVWSIETKATKILIACCERCMDFGKRHELLIGFGNATESGPTLVAASCKVSLIPMDRNMVDLMDRVLESVATRNETDKDVN